MNILSFALSPPPQKNGQAPLTSTIPLPPTIKHRSTQSANYNGNDLRIYMKSYIFGTDHPNLLLWLYMSWFNFILGLNFISLCLNSLS